MNVFMYFPFAAKTLIAGDEWNLSNIVVIQTQGHGIVPNSEKRITRIGSQAKSYSDMNATI